MHAVYESKRYVIAKEEEGDKENKIPKVVNVSKGLFVAHNHHLTIMHTNASILENFSSEMRDKLRPWMDHVKKYIIYPTHWYAVIVPQMWLADWEKEWNLMLHAKSRRYRAHTTENEIIENHRKKTEMIHGKQLDLEKKYHVPQNREYL